MHGSDLPLNPSRRTLRQFAGLWLVFLGASAGWHFVRGDRPVLAAVLAVLAVGVGVPGLVEPRAVRRVYVAAVLLTFPLGWAVSQILLGILFFGVLTPLAVIFRLRGRDALALARPDGRDSYWTEKPAVTDVRRYTQTF